MADELMRDLPRDLPSVLARLGTDAQCRAYLALGRWPDGFRWAAVGSGAPTATGRGWIEECAVCGKQAPRSWPGPCSSRPRRPIPNSAVHQPPFQSG